MAKSAKKCPRFYAGTPLEKARKWRAADSATWKAGQWGYFDSSGYAAVSATDAVNTAFIFCEDQDTSTSSTDVWIQMIPDGTQFVGYISSGDTDAAATEAMIGVQYPIHVGANVVTIDTADSNTPCVIVKDVLWKAEPYKNSSSDSPGQVIFEFIDAILDA